jgi:hypothetical protein
MTVPFETIFYSLIILQFCADSETISGQYSLIYILNLYTNC